jgi:hypothetical protein
MTHSMKVALSAVALFVGLLLAALNLNFGITFIAVVLAIVSLYCLIFSTRGVATGFLETLNGDLEASIYALKTLFSAAEKSVDIVTGQFNPTYYFNPEVLVSLRDAIARGVQVRIILTEPTASLTQIETQIDHDIWKEFIAWQGEGKIWIRRFTGKIPFHFLIVDNKHVRIEETHPENIELKKPYKRRARVVYFYEQAGQYAAQFTKYASQALAA